MFLFLDSFPAGAVNALSFNRRSVAGQLLNSSVAGQPLNASIASEPRNSSVAAHLLTVL